MVQHDSRLKEVGRAELAKPSPETTVSCTKMG